MGSLIARGAAVLFAATLLTGCFDGDSDDDSDDRGVVGDAVDSPSLNQQRTDRMIASEDGTSIAITVFQPELAAGETAPVLLYSHGWGGSRSTDLAGDNVLTQVARRAWEAGYFVVSFDARGFGESGGEVHLQDPAVEGQDIRAIIDWVETNYGPHLMMVNGDLQTGGIGLSYAGGFQLTGAVADPRFDAIVPAVTWHDLSYSLAPNGVAKTLWMTYLYGGGITQGRVAPWIDTLFEESWSGTVSADIRARLAENGISTYCSGQRSDGQGVPQVDAFFIQGINDTLFNGNEAIRNYECLSAAGNDAYLVVARGGHLLPELQAGTPGDFDPEVQCGSERYSLADLAWRFLDGKLRSQQPTIEMPRTCFVVSDTAGIVTEQIPKGGSPFTVQRTLDLGPPSEDNLLGLTDDPADLLEDLPSFLADELEVPGEFVPVHTAAATQNLVGVPLATLNIQGDESLDPRFWMGIGVLRAGSEVPELLHDQVLPIRGIGQISTELVAVSTQLAPGDQVGVMLYDFHPQYARSYNRQSSQLVINASVELPLQ